jgi:hypothetical protein
MILLKLEKKILLGMNPRFKHIQMKIQKILKFILVNPVVVKSLQMKLHLQHAAHTVEII